MATKLQGWPDPWSPIDKATAGALIGVSRDTIERVAARIAAGEPLPNVRNPLAIEVGGLFAAEKPGSPVLAERIYRVLKIDPAKLAGPFVSPAARAAPALSAQKPGAVPSPGQLQSMSDTNLSAELSKTIAATRIMQNQGTTQGKKVPWRKIKALADELSRRSKPPAGMLHGQPLARIDLDKVDTWGFIGVFAATAEPDDLWPFVLPPNGGRPIDLLSASSDDIRNGTIVALTLEEWASLLAEAIAEMRRIEAAKKLEREIYGGLPEGGSGGKRL